MRSDDPRVEVKHLEVTEVMDDVWVASKAREETKKMIRGHLTDELKKIDDGIKQKVKQGEFIYSYEGYISLEAEVELRRCGYKVENNELFVAIEW